MEDLQIWVYIIFGILYFLSRSLRKKRQEPPKQSPLETEGESRPQRRQPASFEELLREITEQRAPEVIEEVRPTVEKEPEPVEEKRPKSFEKEGETRHFSDDRSREIYEQSIKAAEGTSENFQRDDHFKLKAATKKKKARSNALASEIGKMISSPDGAKKAVILSEILNRRY